MEKPMQMGQVDVHKLIRRIGGKNVKTQLNKGDPQIVVTMKTVTESQGKKPQLNYVDAQLRAAFYQALYEVQNADKNAKPDIKLEVLRDTGRIFADLKYKPQLLKAETGHLDETRRAENVILKAYRKKLEDLRYDLAKKGKTKEQEAVTTLIKAVDKKQLLTTHELGTIYDTLGGDVKMQKTQVKPLMDDMKKQGILAEEDVKEFETRLGKKDTVKSDAVTKYMETRVTLRDDYTIASKYLDEDTPGFETYRPNAIRPSVVVSNDPATCKLSKTSKTAKIATKRAGHSVTVNMDDRTDRLMTRVDFKKVGSKISRMNAE